jgi:putative tricarboxylic transport membrane protein
MRTAEILCATLILAVGVLVCYESAQYGIGWGDGGPEAGLYPLLLGIGMIGATVAILSQTLGRWRRGKPPQPFLGAGAWKKVASVAVPASLMILLTQFIGIYLAAGLYLAVYMRWIGRHRWVTIAALSILIPLTGYIVFWRWFLIPLPEGSLWAQLGL